MVVNLDQTVRSFVSSLRVINKKFAVLTIFSKQLTQFLVKTLPLKICQQCLLSVGLMGSTYHIRKWGSILHHRKLSIKSISQQMEQSSAMFTTRKLVLIVQSFKNLKKALFLKQDMSIYQIARQNYHLQGTFSNLVRTIQKLLSTSKTKENTHTWL